MKIEGGNVYVKINYDETYESGRIDQFSYFSYDDRDEIAQNEKYLNKSVKMWAGLSSVDVLWDKA